MPDWNALRGQVHTLLKDARFYERDWSLKSQLRGLSLTDVLPDSITNLVPRAVAADTAVRPEHVRGRAPQGDRPPASAASSCAIGGPGSPLTSNWPPAWILPVVISGPTRRGTTRPLVSDTR
jgi:hypothetical protein